MMQGWLGFPYIYVLTLGILQSIPNDLYEAAYIDGANAWQKFRSITFPMILAVAAPTLISQYTFNDLLPGPGGWLVTFGLVFFAYSTILGWCYYGEKCASYLGGERARFFTEFGYGMQGVFSLGILVNL